MFALKIFTQCLVFAVGLAIGLILAPKLALAQETKIFSIPNVGKLVVDALGNGTLYTKNSLIIRRCSVHP